jgi:ankyrin repeat protein
MGFRNRILLTILSMLCASAIAHAQDAIEIPLRHGGAALFAPLMNNGELVGHLYIDTSARVTTLHKDAMLPFRFADLGSGIESDDAPRVFAAEIEIMSIGPMELRSQIVRVLDAPLARNESGDRVVGVLGMDILGQYPFTLDWITETLTIHKRAVLNPPADVQVFPLFEDSDLPRVRASIEGIEGWFEIDTSLPGAITLTSPFVRLHDVLVRNRSWLFEGGEWADQYGSYWTRWRSFEFLGRNVERTHGYFYVEDGPQSISGIIGQNLLRGARLTIDMPGKRAWAQWGEESLENLLRRLTRYGPRDLANATPVHNAALLLRSDAVRVLLEQGADPNLPDATGITPLMVSAGRGDVESTRLLLARDARLETISRFDDYTALHLAAQYGKGDTAALLVEKGARVEAATDSGRTPLFLAAENDHPDAVAALLRLGARVDASLTSGETPLMAACRSYSVDSVKHLLDRGANPNAWTASGTPLTVAANAGADDIVRLLIERGARIEQPSPDGFTPLAWAAANSRPGKTVEYLLNAGADPNAACADGSTALDFALSSGSPATVQLLRKAQRLSGTP